MNAALNPAKPDVPSMPEAPLVPLTIPRLTAFRASDGYSLCVRIWDANEPAARIVCLHGIISHGGWYLRSCQYLARCGFEVHFVDRRGSGLNAKGRGDVDGFTTWLEDVENYLDALGGSLPRILNGISWGGKLAAAVARHRPWLLDGLALVCPGIAALKGARPVQRIGLRLMNAAGLRGRRVAIPLQDPALFTDHPPWQAYIRDDPLTLRTITARLAVADLALNRYVATAAPGIRVPTLLMLSGQDRIIDNGGVKAFFERLGTPQKQLIEYPAAGHTLEFEPRPEGFFQDLAGWVARCVKGSSATRGLG